MAPSSVISLGTLYEMHRQCLWLLTCKNRVFKKPIVLCLLGLCVLGDLIYEERLQSFPMDAKTANPPIVVPCTISLTVSTIPGFISSELRTPIELLVGFTLWVAICQEELVGQDAPFLAGHLVVPANLCLWPTLVGFYYIKASCN